MRPSRSRRSTATRPTRPRRRSSSTTRASTTPVTIKLQYNPDHYGSSSDQEYNAVKRQLEETGLFKVDLQSTEWVTYSEEYPADAYPVFQLGWFPDFPDADNYLSPFLSPYDDKQSGNFTNSHYNELGTEYADPEMTQAARERAHRRRRGLPRGHAEADPGPARASRCRYLPLLTGSQVAVGVDGVDGLDKTLDPSFKFRFTSLSK